MWSFRTFLLQSLVDLFFKSLSLEICLMQLLTKLVWEFLTMLVLFLIRSLNLQLGCSLPVRLYCWSWRRHPLWCCCQTNRWCSSCEGSWPWLSPVCWLSSWPDLWALSDLARLMSRVTPSLIMECCPSLHCCRCCGSQPGYKCHHRRCCCQLWWHWQPHWQPIIRVD